MINLISWYIGLWNCIEELWKSLEIWARKAHEFYKQRFTDYSSGDLVDQKTSKKIQTM